MLLINLMLNSIEHLARPVSLALRLFGNLYAGEMIFLLLAAAHAGSGADQLADVGGIGWRHSASSSSASCGRCFHILVITLQAFIFMVLTIVYLAQAHETITERVDEFYCLSIGFV